MKLRPLTVVLLLAGALLLSAPVARADDEAPEGSLEEKIRQKLTEIRELMRKNEQALLELSTGKAAKTKRIDVPVPDGQGESGTSKGGDAEGAKSDGASATEKMEKLIKGSQANGGRIPDELKRIVEMIPL